MNPHRLLNEVGANYSTYRIRSFVGVLTRHLMEPNKYASWTLLLGLWAPCSLYGQIMYVMLQDFLMIVQCVSIRHYKHILVSTSEHLHVNLECPQSTLVTPSFSSSHITHALHFHSKILIGASLSKPHTSMTSLHLCVCAWTNHLPYVTSGSLLVLCHVH